MYTASGSSLQSTPGNQYAVPFASQKKRIVEDANLSLALSRMHDHPSWTAMTHNKAIIKQELNGFVPTNDLSPRSYQYPQNGYCQLGHSPIGASDIITHVN